MRLAGLLFALLLGGCSIAGSHGGRGVPYSITFVNHIPGSTLRFSKAESSDGTPYVHPGSLRSLGPKLQGATLGSIDVQPEIPEWADFTLTTQLLIGGKEGPVGKPEVVRVYLRKHVPREVIDEVLNAPPSSTRAGQRSKLLWLYLVWTERGPYVHWELTKGCCDIEKEGGQPP